MNIIKMKLRSYKHCVGSFYVLTDKEPEKQADSGDGLA